MWRPSDCDFLSCESSCWKIKLRLQRIARYRPGGETLTSQQLELLELEPGVSNLEVAAECEREALRATLAHKLRWCTVVMAIL
jgi:hypothetical protein